MGGEGDGVGPVGFQCVTMLCGGNEGSLGSVSWGVLLCDALRRLMFWLWSTDRLKQKELPEHGGCRSLSAPFLQPMSVMEAYVLYVQPSCGFRCTDYRSWPFQPDSGH